jgi:diadenosine tetraphosphatase ApaH/serine/threonine PP2A family protein phosphatase
MRVLILSDVHSNLEALEAVLSAAPPHDCLWCLGDIVGYGPDPVACADHLLGPGIVSVAGNHDWGVIGKIDLADFNPDARRANAWNRAHLSADHLERLAALPTTVVAEGFTLAHGSPREPIWEYVARPSTALPNFQHYQTQVCLVGHTHVPIIFQLQEAATSSYCNVIRPAVGKPVPLGEARAIINPGSVGQPRDGDPGAAYALLDTDAQTITFHRQPYDFSSTQHKMADARLPHRLISRLSVGW